MNRAHRLNLSAGFASVSAALLLVCLKAWALVATGALSVAASLTDSAFDMLLSATGLLSIVYAAKPPDEDHAFGHSSVEDLFALGQSVLVTASAGIIAWRAVSRLGAETPLRAGSTGIGVMAVSIVVTLALVAWQGRVAAQTGSRIVAADRLNYLADLLPALGAIVALAASTRYGIHWIDPAVAIGACLMLLYGAAKLGLNAWHALMDRGADGAQIATIMQTIAHHPGVLGFHDLKTRRAGSRIFIQVHIELDGEQSLIAAHEIGASVRRDLLAVLPGADVIIHKDPAAAATPD